MPVTQIPNSNTRHSEIIMHQCMGKQAVMCNTFYFDFLLLGTF
jgi:hypothetical protein